MTWSLWLNNDLDFTIFPLDWQALPFLGIYYKLNTTSLLQCRLPRDLSVIAHNCLAACECIGVGGTSFEEWVSQAESSCVLPSGQGAAVHHVLIFPTSVSYFCRDTTADDLHLWRFNNEDFNLVQCWTLATAPNSWTNIHVWNKK